jgi:serine/threonine protein phosphatase PrpC
MLLAHGVTDRGRVRPINEDCFAVRDDLQLCVLADGMGGHQAGDIAARLAVDSVVEFVSGAGDEPWPYGFDPDLSDAGNRLRSAVQFANARILEASKTTASCSGMGTTVVAMMLIDRTLTVAHVGDSRLYLLANGRLDPVTQDDSWAALMTADPSVDPAVIQHHPMRHALTGALGTRSRAPVHVTERHLTGGERVLLSSDGVHGVLDETWIRRLMTRTGDVREAAAGLVSAALARGSRDNCTAVVARYLPDTTWRPVTRLSGAPGAF